MIPKSESDLTVITRAGDNAYCGDPATQRVDGVGLYDVTTVGFDLYRADVVGGVIAVGTLNPVAVGVVDEAGVIRISRIRHLNQPILDVVGVGDGAGALAA
jgi:hypothetical protein